jgi:hypothetical protein
MNKEIQQLFFKLLLHEYFIALNFFFRNDKLSTSISKIDK